VSLRCRSGFCWFGDRNAGCWLDVVGCSNVPSGGGYRLPMGEAMDRTAPTNVVGGGGDKDTAVRQLSGVLRVQDGSSFPRSSSFSCQIVRQHACILE
jgi:hypothetical protein